MVDSHSHDSTYEPEVLQMMLIAKTGVGIDLKGVVVTAGRGREGGREGRGREGEQERERKGNESRS